MIFLASSNSAKRLKMGATTLSITTFTIMTLSITIFSIRTLSIQGLYVTLSMYVNEHN
jgi:hypothetical protein